MPVRFKAAGDLLIIAIAALLVLLMINYNLLYPSALFLGFAVGIVHRLYLKSRRESS